VVYAIDDFVNVNDGDNIFIGLCVCLSVKINAYDGVKDPTYTQVSMSRASDLMPQGQGNNWYIMHVQFTSKDCLEHSVSWKKLVKSTYV